MDETPNTDSDESEPDQTSPERYVLRLYVAGNSPRSQRAVRNLSRICQSYFEDCEIEVIDIYHERESARAQQIVGAPTLIKELPLPLRRLIGDLSDEKKVFAALDIETGS